MATCTVLFVLGTLSILFMCTRLLCIARGLLKKKKKPLPHNMNVCLKAQNTSFHTIVTKEVEQKIRGVVFCLIICQRVSLLICDAGFRNCKYEKGRDFASCFACMGKK